MDRIGMCEVRPCRRLGRHISRQSWRELRTMDCLQRGAQASPNKTSRTNRTDRTNRKRMTSRERSELGQLRECVQNLAIQVARLSQAIKPLVRMQEEQDVIRDRVAELQG